MSFAVAPFHVNAEGQAWVESALSSLTDRQKLAQLFTLLSRGDNPEALDAVARFQPGCSSYG